MYTFGHHIAQYKAYLRYERHRSDHTITAYTKDLEQLQLQLAHLEIEDDVRAVKLLHLRQYLLHLIQIGTKERSLMRKKSSIHAFYKYLLRRQVVDTNPATYLRSPKLPKRLSTGLEQQAVAILSTELAIDYHDWNAANAQLIVDLLFETGMRRAELTGLCLQDIDLQRCSLLVTGKGNKERLIPISGEMAKKIEGYIAERKKRFEQQPARLLVLASGLPVYDKYVYLCVQRELAKISTQSGGSPHTLRHTFATSLLNNGASLNSIKDLLGHSSLAATQIYTHTHIQKLQDEYRKAHPKS